MASTAVSSSTSVPSLPRTTFIALTTPFQVPSECTKTSDLSSYTRIHDGDTPSMSTTLINKTGPTCHRVFTDASLTATIRGTQPATAITTVTSGVYAHPPWYIEWDKADRSTLSPRPPILTYARSIPTWKPGDKIDSRRYDGGGTRGCGPSLEIILGTTVPIVCVVGIVTGVVWYLCARHKKNIGGTPSGVRAR